MKRLVQEFFYFYVCIHCRGKVFTEPLPSNGRGINIQTDRFMKYAVEIGIHIHMIHIPSFIMIGSAIQKSIGELHRHTERR
jgi:hypothetical protein